MAKSLKDRICEGLEDRKGLIVPVIRHLMAEAWEEGQGAGWNDCLLDLQNGGAKTTRNPYSDKEQSNDGSEAVWPR